MRAPSPAIIHFVPGSTRFVSSRLRAWAILLIPPCCLAAGTNHSYQLALSSNVMVKMRDGVQLATDIYRPSQNSVAAEGKFPPSAFASWEAATRTTESGRWRALSRHEVVPCRF